MNMEVADHSLTETKSGAGGAAALAAGIGSFALAVLAIAADQMPSLRQAMIFSRPTGPLSGVTTCACIIWLTFWIVLHLRWRNRNVAMGRIGLLSVVLLALAVLLTFPPVAELF